MNFYSETEASGSSGVGLSYAEKTRQFVHSELGARLAAQLSTDSVKTWTLNGLLAWQRNFHTVQTAQQVSLLALPGSQFAVNGAAPDRDLALLEVGAVVETADHVSLGGKMDAQLGARTKAYLGSLIPLVRP